MMRRSQILAALAGFRPKTNYMRFAIMKLPSVLWICLLLSCGIPGPQSSVEEISSLKRYELNGETPATRKIRVLSAGDSASRQVIFIHGTPGSAEGWADFLLSVPPGFRYVALDRPGFGFSGPDHAVVSLAEQARAVRLLFDLKANEKPILIGHSLGGSIAAWVAAEYPDEVAGVLIASGSLDPAQERIHPLQHLAALWPIKHMLPRAIRNANHELMALEKELEVLRLMLDKIRVPVMIVHGTRDKLVPYENVDYMLNHLIGSEKVYLKSLDDQGHFLPWEARKSLEAAILEFDEMIRQ